MLAEQKTTAFKMMAFSLLLSACFTVITTSLYVYVLNIITIILFIGYALYPYSPLITRSLGASMMHIIATPQNLLDNFSRRNSKYNKQINIFKQLGIYSMPIVIIILFISIYKTSNSIFNTIINSITSFFYDNFTFLFSKIDLAFVGSYLISVLAFGYILLRKKYANINETPLVMQVLRTKSPSAGSGTYVAFKNAFKGGVFLFTALNIILLVLNFSDIYLVWINFKWTGELLRGFVHEGTYLLLLSIVISIILVLYYFRGNTNFYSANKKLKYLCYAWLLQNFVLLLSVGLRNYYYIQHYALAYKRLGVIFFLIAAAVGLYSVYIKVKNKKSFSFLLQQNSLSIYTILLVTSFFNWDSIIARYNFSHAPKTFLHLSYLSALSDKALPFLITDNAYLSNINTLQKDKFTAVRDDITIEAYQLTVEQRKLDFIKRWEKKTFLEWNWPEYRAYKMLKK